MEKETYINSVNLNGETDFPYLVLNVVNENSYPRNPGFQVMHWHEGLQFIYVLSGDVEVVTLETSVSLREGDGIFINKNVAHMVRSNGPCHYNSFLFPDYFLKFYAGSPASHFGKCFSAKKGKSPGQYRKQEKGSPASARSGCRGLCALLVRAEQGPAPTGNKSGQAPTFSDYRRCTAIYSENHLHFVLHDRKTIVAITCFPAYAFLH